MRINLNTDHLKKLFELTEMHMDWFTHYYPNSPPEYAMILKRNHKNLLNFIHIDLMGKYTHYDIDRKFGRMFRAVESLSEITEYNRKNKIIINNLSY